ncbi:MAG: outer membrane beta-barrel protein [Xanthobacteraceae bacterium]|nr:outer membrane beta-barrel protein [Xanthobacteraceae bacterium]
MRSLKSLMLAGAAGIVTVSTASAADLPPILYKAPPMQVEEFGGWYLRGDIGFSNQRVGGLFNAIYNDPGVSVRNEFKGFDGAPLIAIGLGYQFNNWLRADITGEYRARANFRGADVATWATGAMADDYYAAKSEWVFMANAYVDLGTWWCLTPFLGAGFGMAYNTIHDFKDVGIGIDGGVPINSVAFGATTSKWNFAWALHAGVAYKVNPGFTVELAYRYMNLGDAQSGDLITYLGGNARDNPMHFNDITSHDWKLGVRWYLQEPASLAPPPPLVRKG